LRIGANSFQGGLEIPHCFGVDREGAGGSENMDVIGWSCHDGSLPTPSQALQMVFDASMIPVQIEPVPKHSRQTLNGSMS
jgi:hypothetical protein